MLRSDVVEKLEALSSTLVNNPELASPRYVREQLEALRSDVIIQQWATEGSEGDWDHA